MTVSPFQAMWASKRRRASLTWRRELGLHRAEHVLHFIDDPFTRPEAETYELFEDGGLVVSEDGLQPLPLLKHGNHSMLLPGFIDTHVHAAQQSIVSSFGEALPVWYKDTCSRATRRSAVWTDNLQYCKEAMEHFVTNELSFATGFTGADRTADKGGWVPEITPRFAPSSTLAMLRACQELLDSPACNGTCYFQTHLAENMDETAWVVAAGFPELKPKSHLDVYDQFGWVRERTMLGHAIHVSDEDVARMAQAGAVGSHCPRSNQFLVSGLFNLGQYLRGGAMAALDTDVGGGDSLSMLAVLNEAYKTASMMKYWMKYQAGRRHAAPDGCQSGLWRTLQPRTGGYSSRKNVSVFCSSVSPSIIPTSMGAGVGAETLV
eukprot:g9046.t1